jgi:hypothetical protein
MGGPQTSPSAHILLTLRSGIGALRSEGKPGQQEPAKSHNIGHFWKSAVRGRSHGDATAG